MVFVNGQKFACESCIKGHRSSGCHHTERVLFKIEKKGRPSTQCDKCRQLRKTQNYHGRCNCSGDSSASASSSKSSRSAKRTMTSKISTLSAYPNGLKDILDASSEITLTGAHPKQRVDTLLNPCDCSDPYSRCHCDAEGKKQLHALRIIDIATTQLKASPVVHPQRIELAPIRDSRETQTQHAAPTLPSCHDASVFPRFVESDRCCCGTQCACPGCKEHRRTPIAPEEPDCPDRCASCVDHVTENALPSTSRSASDHYTGSIDRFLALAATLPTPPKQLRPFDLQQLSESVVVYPSTVFQCENARAVAQLVRIPPLECCGGQCQCPTDNCNCTEACKGCCAENEEETRNIPKQSCCQPADGD